MTVYADLVRYRELFGNLFRRDLHTRYKGSALGVAGSLLNPLILMGIYVLVFSLLWKAAAGIQHYALYLLVGLAPWLFFSSSLTTAPGRWSTAPRWSRRCASPASWCPCRWWRRSWSRSSRCWSC